MKVKENCGNGIKKKILRILLLLQYSNRIFKSISFISTVCVATIREFAETLADDIKSDPKKIEDAFKEYCLTAKSKQQRLVCTSNNQLHCEEECNLFELSIISVFILFAM